MPDIFINTERPVDRSIVAGLNQPQREAAASAWVAGSSYDVNLYFVQNDGTYDAASGQAGQTVELAIAPVSEPESGTFTITDGTATTAAISFGASGQDVEDALNALNGGTGPNLGAASLVDVEKVNDTQYAITFRTLGAMTALSGASVSLYPESTVTGSIAVTGSGSQYAQQVIEVVRQPAIYQPTWSTITNGFNATVALNTTRLLQAIVLERGEPFYLEVKLNGTTVAREVVTVEESNMPASAFAGIPLQSILDLFAADPDNNASFDAATWSAALNLAAGNGDVFGPASAVDSNFAAFDSTTGKLIKDALVSASSFATAAQGALADSASQPGHTHTASDVTDFDTEVSNNTTVAGNEAYTPRVLSGTAKTATFTAVIGETHLVNTSGGGFTANLPAIAGGQGRIAFYFTGTGGNLTVDPNGAETIGGKNTLKLDHGHNTIENDGTEWKLVQRSGVAPFRIDPAQITANQDGYNPADWNNNVTHLYIDSDASREIQGFEEDGFHDMAQVIVTNDGINDIIIKHDTSTTVANRVLVDGGADFTLGANQTGILMRDGTVNKWRFYGINQDLTSYQLQPAEGAFVDGDKTKLDGIEAGADVTDTANVTAAGALMDSEVDADIKTLSLPANTTISTFGAGLVDDADAATARTTLDAQEDISGATITSATVAGTDKVLIQDTDDSDNLKTVTAQSIADLGGGGGGGGLTQVTGTDADTAMAVGNMYVVDMSAWATADRVYSLPSTAAVGDQVGITIKTGDDTYTVDIQTTAASNDTINGVDHDSTPWSKLFQTGETVIMECVTANTEWVVVTDGRIPCTARIHRDDTAGAQTLTTSTFTKIQFTEETFNRGLTTDTSTNYRITVRRDGIYKVFGVWHMDGLIGTGDPLLSSLYVDGSRYNTAWHKTMTSSSDEHSVPVLDTLDLSADSYVELYGYQASGANRDTWANAVAPNYLIVEEIL